VFEERADFPTIGMEFSAHSRQEEITSGLLMCDPELRQSCWPN
jgi:hypothetical protein